MTIAGLCKGDTVVRQTAAHSVSISGDARRTYTDTATLNCLIQTTSARESQKYNAKGSAFSHHVFFSADPGLTVNNRLKWTVRANTTLSVPIYLRVLDCYPEGRPGKDQLWIADCDMETTRSET